MQEIAAGIGDVGVHFLDTDLRLLPVPAELLLVRHGSLITGQT